MNYELTQHAKDMLQEREIALEWLERVLDNPFTTHPDPADEALEHRLGKIAEFNNRVLRIVVNTRGKPVRVITAYFDRTMKGRL
jgi:uncharacterized DUF497 family protein